MQEEIFGPILLVLQGGSAEEAPSTIAQSTRWCQNCPSVAHSGAHPLSLMARYTGPPMDLENTRSLGVTKIDVYCGSGHQSTIDMTRPICPATCRCGIVRLRLRCKCGKRPTKVPGKGQALAFQCAIVPAPGGPYCDVYKMRR
jgi:hypothetical protein